MCAAKTRSTVSFPTSSVSAECSWRDPSWDRDLVSPGRRVGSVRQHRPKHQRPCCQIPVRVLVPKARWHSRVVLTPCLRAVCRNRCARFGSPHNGLPLYRCHPRVLYQGKWRVGSSTPANIAPKKRFVLSLADCQSSSSHKIAGIFLAWQQMEGSLQKCSDFCLHDFYCHAVVCQMVK